LDAISTDIEQPDARLKYPFIFSPLRIGSLTIKNRIALAPMASHLANHEGKATDALIAWYVRRAQGGVGLIISESNYVREDGRGGVDRMGLQDDDRIPGLRQLVMAVHDCGVPIMAQLHHAGHQAPPKAIGQYPIAPSTISLFVRGEIPWVGSISRQLATSEVKELVIAFGNAAWRAKEAGFDGVQIHGAHGYLIHEFLSPLNNRRTDMYGGSPENRARFLLEIIEEVRRRTGSSYPIVVRISGDEYSPAGYTSEDMLSLVPSFEAAGADMIDVSAGRFESYEWVIQPQTAPEGALVDVAGAFKQISKVPVGVAGRLKTPSYVEDVLASGKADLINIGRQLIADPDWVNKVAAGQEDDITPCIACNRCIDEIALDRPIICAVNPLAGRETIVRVEPAAIPRRVMVIGGGVAGMQAALTAAERGHHVSLYERTETLGGQALLAGQVPHYYEIHKIPLYLASKVFDADIELHTGVSVDADLVKRQRPDAVVLAAGAVSEIPHKLPGADLPHVVEVLEVLAGKTDIGPRVVVLGGGINGACAAEYLYDRGHSVTMIKSSVPISAKAGILVRKEHTLSLNELGVKILTGAKVMRILPKEVVISQFGAERSIPADAVILAVGMQPVNELKVSLEALGIPVFIVGDANDPREVLEAIHEGFQAAMQI